MHAMGGVINIRRIGGLQRLMPITHTTFLVGCLALAGFPLLSGFFSKDEILAAVYSRRGNGLYLAPLSRRHVHGTAHRLLHVCAYFLSFHGPEVVPHEAGHHAHESPAVMTWPLVILSVFAAGIGACLASDGALEEFLSHTPSLAYLREAELPATETSAHLSTEITSSLLALAAIGSAWFLYLAHKEYLRPVTRAASAVGLYGLSAGKFYFDWTYNILIVWPLEGIARLSAWFDRNIIDGMVSFVAAVPRAVGGALRLLQSGLVQFYALGMVLGVIVLLWALLM